MSESIRPNRTAGFCSALYVSMSFAICGHSPAHVKVQLGERETGGANGTPGIGVAVEFRVLRVRN
jgi:hypothetical protein